MFSSILVPLDLSDRNERAIEAGMGLAAAAGGRVTLLHVVAAVAGLPRAEMREFYQRLERRARARLEVARRRHLRDGVRATVSVVVGDPARAILAAASRRRADLIVMRSHSVEPGGEVGWATVSYKVALLCRCPVLLVK